MFREGDRGRRLDRHRQELAPGAVRIGIRGVRAREVDRTRGEVLFRHDVREGVARDRKRVADDRRAAVNFAISVTRVGN